MKRVLFAGFWVVAAMFVGGPARADATSEAGEAYDEGARAYDARDYPRAAKSFALADEKVPSGRALELAMASSLLANDAALGMDLVVRAERRSVDGSLASLAAKLRRKFADTVGSVTLVCASGTVCRGDLEGRALVPGVPRHGSPGPHTVVVTSDDTTSSIVVSLVRGSDTLANAPGAPAPPAPPRPTLAPRPAEAPPRAGLSPVYFGVVAGLGVVGLGTAIGLTAMTSGLHDDFLAAPSRASADAGNEAQTATRVVWGVTTALVLASAVLFVVTDFGGERTKLAIGPGNAVLVGTF